MAVSVSERFFAAAWLAVCKLGESFARLPRFSGLVCERFDSRRLQDPGPDMARATIDLCDCVWANGHVVSCLRLHMFRRCSPLV